MSLLQEFSWRSQHHSRAALHATFSRPQGGLRINGHATRAAGNVLLQMRGRT